MLNTKIGENYYYSSQIDSIVRVDDDNGDGTALCYTGYSYVTLDVDKLSRQTTIKYSNEELTVKKC